MFSLAAAAALVAGASAQFAPAGEWEKVQLSFNQDMQQVPSSNVFRRAATTGGTFIVTSGNAASPGSTALSNTTFQYDHTTNKFSAYPVIPAAEGASQTVTFGGYVLQLNPTTILVWDTSIALTSCPGTPGPTDNCWQNPNLWTTITLPPSPGGTAYPANLNGGRAVLFGSTLYYFGGAKGGFGVGYTNGLWSLDLAAVLQVYGVTVPIHTSPVGWIPLVSPGIPSSALPPTTYPAPRGNFAFETVGGILVMHGGWNPSDENGNEAHYSDVWFFAPGYPAPAPTDPSAAGVAANPYISAWKQMPTVPANGNPAVCAAPSSTAPTVYNPTNCGLPVARGGHSHGMYGDNLFIYGGYTMGSDGNYAQLGDMWILNLPSAQWFNIPQVAPYPQPVGFTSGLVVGRHFYLQMTTCPFALPPAPPPACGAGANQLWRWSTPIGGGGRGPPGGGGGGGSGSGSGSANNAGYTAHSWGLAIGILVGLFNAYVLVLLAQNSGVEVFAVCKGAYEGALGLCGRSSSSGSSSRAAPASAFYSSVESGKADGGYVAPPA